MHVGRVRDRIKYQILGFNEFKSHKVIGIGLSKTATTSLSDGLGILGFRSIHYPPIAQIEAGRCRLSWPWWMNKYNAMSDLPAAALFRELSETFGNADFVLTVRDRDDWMDSCRRHFTLERFTESQRNYDFKNGLLLNKYVFGSNVFEKNLFKSSYDRHIENVRDYFSSGKTRHRLLEMDICGGDGWSKLCEFLGHEVPHKPFPFSNKNSKR